MNGVVQFRKCTLTDEQLAKKVDNLSDKIYETGKIPNRMIPARPDEDYDLLVGELIVRFLERIKNDEQVKQRLELASDLEKLTYNFATGKEGSEEELIKYVREKLEAI